MRIAFSTLSLVLALSGCERQHSDDAALDRVESSQPADEKPAVAKAAEMATACEISLRQNLSTPDSFDANGKWSASEFESIVTLVREYSAVNGFGTQISSSYRCKFNRVENRVIALSIGRRGVWGTTLIRDEQAAEREDRSARIQAGAERALQSSSGPQSAGPGERRWITNLFFTGCPEASDWFEAQDAVEAGRWDFELPSRCFEIPVGTIVFAPSDEHREVVTRNGHDYQKARLEDGRQFWTDQLDELSLSLH